MQIVIISITIQQSECVAVDLKDEFRRLFSFQVVRRRSITYLIVAVEFFPLALKSNYGNYTLA